MINSQAKGLDHIVWVEISPLDNINGGLFPDEGDGEISLFMDILGEWFPSGLVSH